MKIGITRFPGTNCDYDIWKMVAELGHQPEWLWHQEGFDTKSVDAVVIPGGFSYGDYLRCGALASRSNVMKSVKEFADKGGPVLGICNGFQILCESGLLPGALLRNMNLTFVDKWVELVVNQPNAFFAKKLKKNEMIRLPIAHGEGRFFSTSEDLKRIEDQGQVWLRYKDNPNGSLNDIAGISNGKGNVVGLMPHPERAIAAWMGSADGGCFL